MSFSRMYSSRQLYARLERTTNLIARHPDFPGKAEAVLRCREDIEARFHQGILTVEERTRLLAILDGRDPLD